MSAGAITVLACACGATIEIALRRGSGGPPAYYADTDSERAYDDPRDEIRQCLQVIAANCDALDDGDGARSDTLRAVRRIVGVLDRCFPAATSEGLGAVWVRERARACAESLEEVNGQERIAGRVEKHMRTVWNAGYLEGLKGGPK